jgi:hypothetical protein
MNNHLISCMLLCIRDHSHLVQCEYSVLAFVPVKAFFLSLENVIFMHLLPYCLCSINYFDNVYMHIYVYT